MSLDAIFFFIEIFWKRRLSRPVRPPQPSHLYGILFIGFLLRNVVCRRLFATFAAMHVSGKHQACEFQHDSLLILTAWLCLSANVFSPNRPNRDYVENSKKSQSFRLFSQCVFVWFQSRDSCLMVVFMLFTLFNGCAQLARPLFVSGFFGVCFHNIWREQLLLPKIPFRTRDTWWRSVSVGFITFRRTVVTITRHGKSACVCLCIHVERRSSPPSSSSFLNLIIFIFYISIW